MHICTAAIHISTYAPPLCTAMHRRYAPLCTTRYYGGTAMHRYAPPVCTAMRHCYARRAAMGVPLCTAMHDARVERLSATSPRKEAGLTATRATRTYAHAAQHTRCTAMHRRYAPLCTTRCYGGTAMHRYAPLCTYGIAPLCTWSKPHNDTALRQQHTCAHSGTSGLPLLRTALPRLLAGAEIDITSVKDVSTQSAIVRSTLQVGAGSATHLEELWLTTLRIE